MTPRRLRNRVSLCHCKRSGSPSGTRAGSGIGLNPYRQCLDSLLGSTDHLRWCLLAGLPPGEYSLGVGTAAVCRERAGEQWVCGRPSPWPFRRARPAPWRSGRDRATARGAQVQSSERTAHSPKSALNLLSAARRVSSIKAQYGNTAAEDDLLRRLLRDKLTGPVQTRVSARLGRPGDEARPRAGPIIRSPR